MGQKADIIRGVPFGEKKRRRTGCGTMRAVDFHTAKETTLRWRLGEALDRLLSQYCDGHPGEFNRIMDEICHEATVELEASVLNVLTSGDGRRIEALGDTTQEYLDHVLTSVLFLLGDLRLESFEFELEARV